MRGGLGWELLGLHCESIEGSVGQSPWKEAGSCPRRGGSRQLCFGEALLSSRKKVSDKISFI